MGPTVPRSLGSTRGPNEVVDPDSLLAKASVMLCRAATITIRRLAGNFALEQTLCLSLVHFLIHSVDIASLERLWALYPPPSAGASLFAECPSLLLLRSITSFSAKLTLHNLTQHERQYRASAFSLSLLTYAQLLNSVLSSINTGQEGKTTNPSANAPASKPTSAPRRDNGALGAARPPAASTNLPPKRKAEDVGRDVKNKAQRVDSAATLSAPVSRSNTISPAPRQGLAPPPKQQVPYRGTMGGSRPPLATGLAPKATTGTSSTPTTPSVAPKSGYLATLERARAAQEAAKQLGQLKHKPTEKLTKKDRLRMQAEAAAAQKGKGTAARGVAGVKARSKSADPVDSKTGAVKKERKPVDLGYKGTMRAAPAPLSYSGTMRPAGSAAARKPQPGPSKEMGGRYRYASYSDEEDEEEEDYESESDMEAGMDDVDLEEEEALRIARREDAEALREENELKRAKLEKKRKLEQLVASRKKTTRY